MNDENFEKLATRWPEIFEKASVEYFEVDNGWYNIIDVLCGMICSKVQNTKSAIRYEQENNPNSERLIELEKRLEQELEEIPVIEQVKEKFGKLRFYVDRYSEKIDNYISFAEAMSGRICEQCGAPGESRSGGWIKVLCDKHAKVFYINEE